ncbi:MAG TPA: hypothetical protein VF847_05880, partial [Candidatus Deferrimicrobiaceae bacterium]
YRDGRAAEAVTAFENLSGKNPADDSLKVWKALAWLEQARQMREEKKPGYQALVERSYAVLKPLAGRQSDNPDWYYAVAKAYWLNNRSMKADKALKKAIFYRPVFPEAWMMLGDLAFEEGVNAPPPPLTGPPGNPSEVGATKAGEEYTQVLNTPGLRPDLQAEACYKMGLVESVLRKKTDPARDWWGKAVAAAPGSRYGALAQEKLAQGKP